MMPIDHVRFPSNRSNRVTIGAERYNPHAAWVTTSDGIAVSRPGEQSASRVRIPRNHGVNYPSLYANENWPKV
jgi:hypothetical protein